MFYPKAHVLGLNVRGPHSRGMGVGDVLMLSGLKDSPVMATPAPPGGPSAPPVAHHYSWMMDVSKAGRTQHVNQKVERQWLPR